MTLNILQSKIEKLFASFLNLNTREKILISGLLTGLVAYGLYIGVFEATVNKLQELKRAEKTYKQSIRQLTQQIMVLKKASKDEIGVDMNKLNQLKVEAPSEVNDVIKILMKQSHALKSNIISLDYEEKGKNKSSGLNSIHVDINLLGSYFHLVEYIYALRELPFITTINSFTLSPAEFDGELNMVISCELFYF